VEADLPDEADVPPDGHVDRRDDQTGSGRTARPAGTEAETRSHEECYNDLRVAEARENPSRCSGSRQRSRPRRTRGTRR